MKHWRLHAAIGTITSILFPLAGLSLEALLPDPLPRPLWLGVLFVCALPSAVQSSIALTSIAGGNVPGVVCSATVSNIAGIALAPLLLRAMSNLDGSGVAERNRPLLAISDRGSILLVVYTAFSAAVVRGIWQEIPPTPCSCWP